jgi:Tfp pilus assembly protein PilN
LIGNVQRYIDGFHGGDILIFQNSLGIDIRTDRIAIAYVKTFFKGIRLAAYELCSLETSQPMTQKHNIFIEFIGNFIRKHHVTAADIYLGIPGDMTILREITLPLAAKENLRSTLQYEMEKYIPLSLNDIYFDCQIIEEDKTNNLVRVLLVVIKKKDLEPYLELKDQIGGDISGIELASMGMANFLNYHPDMTDQGAVLFVNPNDHVVEIGFIKNNFLKYCKSIPLTQDTGDLFELIKEELNVLKRMVGDGDAPIKMAICNNRLSEEGIKQLKTETGLDPVFLNTSHTGLPTDELASAFGIALKGLKKMPMRINLVPVELRKKPSRTAYNIMIILTGLVILSVLSWGGSRIMHRRIILDRLNNEIKRLAPEVELVNRLDARVKAIETDIDQLNTIRRDRVLALDILKELSERIPESGWVQELNFSEKVLQLSGFAQSASELISLLEASPLFEDVVFLSTITKSKDGKERFRIGLKIK